MILINSIENDYSTNDVIDWLKYNDQEIVRVNETSKISDLNIVLYDGRIDFSFKHKNNLYSLNDVKSYWFRRGTFNLNDFVCSPKIESDIISKGIYSHLFDEELKTVEEFFVYILQQKKKIGSYFQGNANKLKSLLIAQELELLIPDSIISSSKKNLQSFHHKYENVVSKGVQDNLSFVDNTTSYSHATEIIEKGDLEEMNRSFFPSLLQANISKRYELRIFYLNGEFDVMAIFSQADKQTQVDFRNYNYDKPNRNVPYNLPFDIEQKLDLFMKKMDLDTGSIDMIVTSDLKYVFLEVNPVGQYGMTSIPCNYYLDEKIAKYLAN